MAITEHAPIGGQEFVSGLEPKRQGYGSTVVSWLTSTDHKVIGYMYLYTAFFFFLVAGIMAMVIRTELFAPGMMLQSKDQFNQLFTMHGTIMLFLFATPLFTAFGNIMLPLQIGAPDVAFPRLNMFSFWLFFFGGFIAIAGFLTPGGAASMGWTGYVPLSLTPYTPGVGVNLWIAGLAMTGFGTIFGSVNFIATTLTMRAPGMTMFRMPVFTWNILITSILVLMAFPPLAAAMFGLLFDRVLGGGIFAVEAGGPVLWQHLFWFFGHPEVYILALPFFGIISEVIPVFSRKPIFGYKALIFATISIAALSVSVWAHHMYTSGQVLLPFALTLMIVSPIAGKLADKIGGKILVILGMLTMAAGGFYLAHFRVDTSVKDLMLPFIVMGVGMGLCQSPLTNLALLDISSEEVGGASGVLSTARQIGSVMGIAILGAFLQTKLATNIQTKLDGISELPQSAKTLIIDNSDK